MKTRYRAPALSLGDAALDGDPDEVGGSGDAELGFDLAAGVGDGLVADADRRGDLIEAAPAAEEPQDLEFPRRQLLQRRARRVDVRERQFLGDLVLDVALAGGDPPDGFE